jgi:hypothetical protein
VQFEIIGEIKEIETFAAGKGIREIDRLRKTYGNGRWRKCKGIAWIKLNDQNQLCLVELHWYEASDIGRREFKIKYYLD